MNSGSDATPSRAPDGRERLLPFLLRTVCIAALVCRCGPHAPTGTHEARALSTDQKTWLMEHINTGSFGELDSALLHYQKLFEQDLDYEYVLWDVWHSFRVADVRLSAVLTAWTDSFPESGTAYLALAQHYLALANDTRGPDWSEQTPEENTEGKQRYAAAAGEAARTALAKNPRLITAYAVLMEVAGTFGDTRLSEKYLRRAIKLSPYCFMIRAEHMSNLAPRWGGSYEQMAAFARKSLMLLDRNPRLALLKGFLPMDVGSVYELKGDTAMALRYYTKAVDYGNYWKFYHYRGRCHYRRKDYLSALRDFHTALAYRPQQQEILLWRSLTYYNLARQEKARGMQEGLLERGWDDICLAEKVDPGNTFIQKWVSHFRRLTGR